jgi:uncharacterized protein HemY
MDKNSKSLLLRWQALEKGDGIQQVKSMIRRLDLFGFAASLIVVYCIYFKLNPIFVALAAIVLGWVVAERNALRSRMDQWSFLKQYIDWQRVEQDVSKHEDKTQQTP